MATRDKDSALLFINFLYHLIHLEIFVLIDECISLMCYKCFSYDDPYIPTCLRQIFKFVHCALNLTIHTRIVDLMRKYALTVRMCIVH